MKTFPCLLLFLLLPFIYNGQPLSNYLSSNQNNNYNYGNQTTVIPTLKNKFLRKILILPKFKFLICKVDLGVHTEIDKFINSIAKKKGSSIGSDKSAFGSKLHTSLTPTQIASLFVKTDWIRALVIRDPLERFLHVFGTHCQTDEADGGNKCEHVFDLPAITFETVIAKLFHIKRVHSPGFTQQSEFCGGLINTFSYYNRVFVVHSDNNISTSALSDDIQTFFLNTRLPLNITKTKRFGEQLASTFQYHNYNDNNRQLINISQIYNQHPCYIRGVVDFYSEDYTAFRLPYPSWALAALQSVTRQQCILWANQITNNRSEIVYKTLQELVSKNNSAPHGEPTLRPSYLQKFAVIPQYKLLFCLVEKVANTAFAKIFRAIRRPYLVRHDTLDLWAYHTPYLYNLSTSDLAGILSRDDWVKAVFYRDPLERFLSAFISKCQEKDKDGGPICKRAFGQPNITFHRAILRLYRPKLIGDPHFASQTEFCGGLNNTLHHYSHVHRLQPSSSRQQLLTILAASHIPLTKNINSRISNYFPSNNNNDNSNNDNNLNATIGNANKGVHYGAEHFTNSSDLSQLLRYYSHPCYVHAVIRYYQSDYAVFRLPYPGWTQPLLQQMTLTQCISWAVKEQQRQQSIIKLKVKVKEDVVTPPVVEVGVNDNQNSAAQQHKQQSTYQWIVNLFAASRVVA